MRKKDFKLVGRTGKTISFDNIVLRQLEKRARETNSTVSNLVNTIMRQKIMSDSEFYKELSKFHYLKFQEFQFMKEQTLIKIETR